MHDRMFVELFHFNWRYILSKIYQIHLLDCFSIIFQQFYFEKSDLCWYCKSYPFYLDHRDRNYIILDFSYRIHFINHPIWMLYQCHHLPLQSYLSNLNRFRLIKLILIFFKHDLRFWCRCSSLSLDTSVQYSSLLELVLWSIGKNYRSLPLSIILEHSSRHSSLIHF